MDEIIVEGGRVVGVQTVKDGAPWRVGARLGVLLNAGGFARNQRMRDRYIPKTSAEWTNALTGDTREMIEEAQRLGAALVQMDAWVGNQMMLPPDQASAFKPMVQMEITKPHAILVDQTGMRYMNEGGSYFAFCCGLLARDEIAPAIPSWVVVDKQFMIRYMFSGTMPGARKPEAWYDSGYSKKADTLADLARQMSVKPEALEATVTRYNSFARAGRDLDFHRGDRAYDRWLGDAHSKTGPTLGAIEKPRFYAAQVYPRDVGTYGGVVTDAYARVLKEDGSVIDGLYATGVTTASVFGRAYPGAGASIGPSFVWGYVAAKHAAGAGNCAGADVPSERASA